MAEERTVTTHPRTANRPNKPQGQERTERATRRANRPTDRQPSHKPNGKPNEPETTRTASDKQTARKPGKHLQTLIQRKNVVCLTANTATLTKNGNTIHFYRLGTFIKASPRKEHTPERVTTTTPKSAKGNKVLM